MRHEIEMHHYQDEAVEFAHANPKCFLWIDMGLGKTVTMATVLRDLIADGRLKKALIVAPLKVATQTWPNEFAEWEHLHRLKYTLIRHDNAAERRKLAFSNTLIHIINREMLGWLVETYAEIKRWPYDTLIIDESSSFKDHRTERFKALRRTLGNFKRIYELTATPATESYMGLFSQTYIVDKGQRFGDSITRFRKAYFDHNPYTKSYTPQPGAEETIASKLSDITLVMMSKDYLDVEEPQELDRKIRLAPKELRAYQDFKKDLILKLPSDIEIEALTGAALNQKLMQAASGCVYDDAKVAHPFHDHKLEDLEEVIEAADGTPVLIGYWFKSSLHRLQKRFPKALKLDKEGKLVEPWNQGKIPQLLAHPMSAGHGLNMQYGPCRDIYMFDTPWSHELYTQFIRRVARQGQKNVVRVHRAITQGTVDEDVMEGHERKEGAQNWLFQRLKADIRNIRK